MSSPGGGRFPRRIAVGRSLTTRKTDRAIRARSRHRTRIGSERRLVAGSTARVAVDRMGGGSLLAGGGLLLLSQVGAGHSGNQAFRDELAPPARAMTRASVPVAWLGLPARAILALLAGAVPLAGVLNATWRVPAAGCRGGALSVASRDPAVSTGGVTGRRAVSRATSDGVRDGSVAGVEARTHAPVATR
jgi:hypothetical protein